MSRLTGETTEAYHERIASGATVTPDQPQAVPDMVLRAEVRNAIERSFQFKSFGHLDKESGDYVYLEGEIGAFLACCEETAARVMEALAARPVLPVETPAEGLREDTARLDWLEAHWNAELFTKGGCDDDDRRWSVQFVNGGRNDREWTEMGQGETAREAIDEAMFRSRLDAVSTAPAPLSGRDGSLREAVTAIAARYEQYDTPNMRSNSDYAEAYVLAAKALRAALAAVPPETAEMEGLQQALEKVRRGLDVAKLGLARDGVQHAKLVQLEGIVADALANATAEVTDDVRALVIAARNVAFGDAPTPGVLEALDKASEAFATRVPWENEP